MHDLTMLTLTLTRTTNETMHLYMCTMHKQLGTTSKQLCNPFKGHGCFNVSEQMLCLYLCALHHISERCRTLITSKCVFLSSHICILASKPISGRDNLLHINLVDAMLQFSVACYNQICSAFKFSQLYATLPCGKYFCLGFSIKTSKEQSIRTRGPKTTDHKEDQ